MPESSEIEYPFTIVIKTGETDSQKGDVQFEIKTGDIAAIIACSVLALTLAALTGYFSALYLQ